MTRPDESSEPVFREPWEATAQAMAHSLVEAGIVTPAEWAEALGEAIKDAQAAGDPDDGTTYYRHVLNALAALLERKGLVSGDMLKARTEDWARAFATTPHGQPVVLSPDTEAPGDSDPSGRS